MSRADVEAGRAYVTIFVKNSRLLRGLEDARRSIQRFGGDMQSAGLRAAGMGAAILAPIAAAVSAASRFEEAYSKFATVFGSNTEAVKTWGDEFAAQVGRSQTQMVEFLGAAQDTFVPLGFDDAEAEKMSKQLTTLAIDLASFNNISDQDAFDRLLSSMVGNTENLRAFGVVAQDTQIKAKALSMGYDPANLTAYTKAVVIMQLAMEGTSAAQGDATKTAGSFANQQKRLLGLATDTAVTLGTAFLPVLSKMAAQLGDLASPLGALIKNNEGLATVIATTATAMVGAGVATAILGTLVKSSAMVFTVFSAAVKTASVVTGLFAAASTVADIAILATTALLGAAAGSATGNTVAFAAMAALQTSYPAVAGIVTAALGVIGAGLTANITLSGAGTLAAGLMASAWTAAAGVMASAWAVMSAPALPFIAAAAGIVAVIAAIAASAAYAAARGIDFGGAWDGIKSTLMGAIQTIKEVGSVLMTALSAGQYTDAANVLWLGMKIAFFEGLNSIVDAIKFLLGEGWEFIKRFFTGMLTKTLSLMKALGDAMLNPLSAGSKLQGALSSLSNTTISLDFSVNADKARAELAKLKTQLGESQEGQAGGGIVDQLAKAGILSADQAKALSQVVDTKKMGVDDDKTTADLYEREIDALTNEILALEEGADAAERMKFAKQGLNVEQIIAIENLRKHRDAVDAEKKAIEEATEAEKEKRKIQQGKQDDSRLNSIAKRGDQLLEQGVNPEEIKRREMAQIQTDVQSGRLSPEAAEKANEDAEQRRISRREQLEEEGRQLARSVMTPQEILNEKLRNISQKQDNGVISSTVAERAEDKARKEFVASQKEGGGEKVESKQRSAGTVVSSSAVSLMAQGRGGENPMLSKFDTMIADNRQARKERNESDRETRRAIKESGGIQVGG